MQYSVNRRDDELSISSESDGEAYVLVTDELKGQFDTILSKISKHKGSKK